MAYGLSRDNELFQETSVKTTAGAGGCSCLGGGGFVRAFTEGIAQRGSSSILRGFQSAAE